MKKEFKQKIILDYDIVCEYGNYTKGSLKKKTTLRYNRFGKEINKIIEVDNRVLEAYSYSYDERSNLIGEIKFKENNIISYKRIFKYDSDSNLVDKYSCGNNGKVVGRRDIWGYNEFGKVKTRTLVLNEFSEPVIWSSEYDDYQNLNRETRTEKNSITGETKIEEVIYNNSYKFDDAGNIKEFSYTRFGRIDSNFYDHEIYRYDDENRVVEHLRSSSETGEFYRPLRYEIEYDKNNNVIKFLEFKDGVFYSEKSTEYNEEGIKLKETITYKDTSGSVIDFDLKGNVISEVHYHSENIPSRRVLHTYECNSNDDHVRIQKIYETGSGLFFEKGKVEEIMVEYY